MTLQASKVIPWKRGDVRGDTFRTREFEEVEVDVKADKPPKVPVSFWLNDGILIFY